MSRPVVVSDTGPLIALERMQDNGYRVSRTLVDATLRLAGEAR